MPQQEGAPRLSGPAGTRFRNSSVPPSSPQCTPSESLINLPYSAQPTSEYPADVFLYSNYNFTDVKRELEVFSPLPGDDFSITDRSSAMGGSALPPGLRFPTGAILGTHLIIAGTYLAHSYQSFSIWALDLSTMNWSRIDPGATLSTGSWCRGCLWESANKFLIFGNRDGRLVDDYNRRLLSWEHVAYIDLEAFGIYQPPPLLLDIPAQELGLAAFEEQVAADFDIVCDDGRKVRCSRKVLEDRWPWFKEQRKLYLQAALEALQVVAPPGTSAPYPDMAPYPNGEPRPDPRLTPRTLHLAEPYPITVALVQYFYAQALITPLQHAPAVLSALLLLSSTYALKHLENLVTHAMHRALSPQTSVGVYEVATLCNCQSLQIRALKVVMQSSSRRPQGRSNRPDRGEPQRTNGSRAPDSDPGARQRGMSDGRPPGENGARMVNGNGYTPPPGSGGYRAANSTSRGGAAVTSPGRHGPSETTSPGSGSRSVPPTPPHARPPHDAPDPGTPRSPGAGRQTRRTRAALASVPETRIPAAPMQPLSLDTSGPPSSHPYRHEPLSAQSSTSAQSSAGPSPMSSPQTEYEDLFYGGQPEAVSSPGPHVPFHLPLRSRGNASMSYEPASASTQAQSRPVTASSVAQSEQGYDGPDTSISSIASSSNRTSEVSLDQPVTPGDSPWQRPFDDLKTSGSNTPTKPTASERGSFESAIADVDIRVDGASSLEDVSPLSRVMSLSKPLAARRLEKKRLSEMVRPGSRGGETKSEEKRRQKELDRVKLERIAGEAKLRAYQLAAAASAPRLNGSPTFERTPARDLTAYTSIGGM